MESPESRQEECEKVQENATVPVEILQELMDMAQRGEGELMNMSNPNREALKGLFRDIYFELEKYLPEEPPTEEHPAEKTES